MYARNVTFRVKANMQSDHIHTFENQVLPLLRKQKGFQDEITCATPVRRMRFHSVCGRTSEMQTITTPASTPKC